MSRNISTLSRSWYGKSTSSVTSLHQLSPYIGRSKPAMARKLIEEFSDFDQTIYDPYSGSGTMLLEGWLQQRNVIGTDLSPYAVAVSKGKLNPLDSESQIELKIRGIADKVSRNRECIDLRSIPNWVRIFFHPETLRELILWFRFLIRKQEWFLLACLLGILHHQRPGFLSYPASHAVPYLRTVKFPRDLHPLLYEYRDISSRLERKAKRMLKNVPDLDRSISRICIKADSLAYFPKRKVDLVITSPPYMGRLAYGRDNRLRLWFLGFSNIVRLDSQISPNSSQFLAMIRRSLVKWRKLLQSGNRCVLILGDEFIQSYKAPLYHAVSTIATHEVQGFRIESMYTESIPDINRVRHECRGNTTETILVLKVR